MTVEISKYPEINSLKTDTELIARAMGRWFFVGMAFVFIATSIAGFLPAIINPATRRAPLTPLAEAHGIVFFMWLLLYLAQSLLIANRRVALHRRLGLTSVVLLTLMIPLGFTTTMNWGASSTFYLWSCLRQSSISSSSCFI